MWRMTDHVSAIKIDFSEASVKFWKLMLRATRLLPAEPNMRKTVKESSPEKGERHHGGPRDGVADETGFTSSCPSECGWTEVLPVAFSPEGRIGCLVIFEKISEQQVGTSTPAWSLGSSAQFGDKDDGSGRCWQMASACGRRDNFSLKFPCGRDLWAKTHWATGQGLPS